MQALRGAFGFISLCCEAALSRLPSGPHFTGLWPDDLLFYARFRAGLQDMKVDVAVLHSGIQLHWQCPGTDFYDAFPDGAGGHNYMCAIAVPAVVLG